MEKRFLTKLRNVTKVMILTVLSFLLHQNDAFAQGATTAALSGVIIDEQGVGLPGASVIVIHEPTGTQYSAVTRDDGQFNIVNMPCWRSLQGYCFFYRL